MNMESRRKIIHPFIDWCRVLIIFPSLFGQQVQLDKIEIRIKYWVEIAVIGIPLIYGIVNEYE